jgi:hypothetical protein
VLSAAAGAKTQEIRGFSSTAPVRVCPVTANSGCGAATDAALRSTPSMMLCWYFLGRQS